LGVGCVGFIYPLFSCARTEKDPDLGPKKGSKIRARGPPGRGVLRFSRPAYRRPVHFLAKNAFFSKKWTI